MTFTSCEDEAMGIESKLREPVLYLVCDVCGAVKSLGEHEPQGMGSWQAILEGEDEPVTGDGLFSVDEGEPLAVGCCEDHAARALVERFGLSVPLPEATDAVVSVPSCRPARDEVRSETVTECEAKPGSDVWWDDRKFGGQQNEGAAAEERARLEGERDKAREDAKRNLLRAVTAEGDLEKATRDIESWMSKCVEFKNLRNAETAEKEKALADSVECRKQLEGFAGSIRDLLYRYGLES
jgi:hypothetical protein